MASHAEQIDAIKSLLESFIDRYPDRDGEFDYTVRDHYYVDTAFFSDLFTILDNGEPRNG